VGEGDRVLEGLERTGQTKEEPKSECVTPILHGHRVRNLQEVGFPSKNRHKEDGRISKLKRVSREWNPSGLWQGGGI